MTDLLITSGCSVNMPPSPICTAVIEQDIELVEWLITKGANVNDIMPLILNAGARINCFNNYKDAIYVYPDPEENNESIAPVIYPR